MYDSHVINLGAVWPDAQLLYAVPPLPTGEDGSMILIWRLRRAATAQSAVISWAIGRAPHTADVRARLTAAGWFIFDEFDKADDVATYTSHLPARHSAECASVGVIVGRMLPDERAELQAYAVFASEDHALPDELARAIDPERYAARQAWLMAPC
ncbi:MAG TPA: hypothetical protein P5255_13995 [Phycisphaerae bacterium]|nr:hypothetical protein [Phycisphaerae bacterium]HRT42825.1 hypothetical protein [Phycisphaerae bacterium]